MLNTMPKIALGTWMIQKSEEIKEVVPAALKNGYEHIDTAQVYLNESFIGEALKTTNVPREKYWITSKVWVTNFRYHAYESVKKSLERLQLDYIDTMLLHAMGEPQDVIKAYKELMKARDEKLVRTIGVSNFSIEMLELIKKETGEYPKYNQIVASVIQRIEKLEEFCKEKGIVLMGYSSIRPYYNPNSYYANSGLTDEQKKIIDNIAEKYSTSPAMVMLRWTMNHDYVILPKSTKAERVISNFKVSEVNLSKEDMDLLDKMNTYTYEQWLLTMDAWSKDKPTEEEYKSGILM